MRAEGQDKKDYRALCGPGSIVPIFSTDWWLDAACGPEHWDVVIARRGDGSVTGALPYYMRRYGLYNCITQPKLTQKMGPTLWFPEDASPSSRLSLSHKTLQSLIEGLPRFAHFAQIADYSLQSWLPFYWNGFTQETRYSYVIPDISDPDAVFANMDSSKRRNIRKARKAVTVDFTMTARAFYDNHVMTLGQTGKTISYSFDLFERLYEAAQSRGQGQIIAARDKEENIHSALFGIWDDMSAYHLTNTIDARHKNSASASLLFFEMIKYVSGKTKMFDFEGSMIEPVERSYRKFGTEPRALHKLTKTRSTLVKIALGLRGV